MTTVTVNIMGNFHNIACGEGQEESINSLAGKVNKKYEELGLKASRVPENLSFAIISMTLIDEVESLKSEISKLTQISEKNTIDYTTNTSIITAINDITNQIYTIAENLKKG